MNGAAVESCVIFIEISRIFGGGVLFVEFKGWKMKILVNRRAPK